MKIMTESIRKMVHGSADSICRIFCSRLHMAAMFVSYKVVEFSRTSESLRMLQKKAMSTLEKLTRIHLLHPFSDLIDHINV